MIKRASPVDNAQPSAQLDEVIALVERALELASNMQMHRTAAALDDALIQANRALQARK